MWIVFSLSANFCLNVSIIIIIIIIQHLYTALKSCKGYGGAALNTPILSVLLSSKCPSKNHHVHCVHEKNAPKHVQKTSKLASFAQLQFSNMNICLFSIKLPILVKICPTVIEILTFNKWSLSPVYTIQPVVKPVSQPIWQPAVSCKQAYNRLSNATGCQTGLTTGWMFVYTIQPVVTPVVKPGCTTGLTTGHIHDTAGLSNRLLNGFDNRLDNRLYLVNGALKFTVSRMRAFLLTVHGVNWRQLDALLSHWQNKNKQNGV